jgi:hypothetical protein
MNLSYTLPKAEENIIAGIKIHTCRKDQKNRWQKGMKIHHCYSFRSKTGYKCFFENVCTGTQKLFIVLVPIRKKKGVWQFDVKVNIDRKRWLDPLMFAKNDGFENLTDFINWFFPDNKKGVKKHTMWYGKLIHWTDLIYTDQKK